MGHRLYEVVREENVAMPARDGTVLRGNVQRPAAAGRFPVLLQRNAYGKGWPVPHLVQHGYIVVDQDLRGRYASDGDYHPMYLPGHTDREDGADAVVWCHEYRHGNGQVGTFGASYNAWTQWNLAPERPPGLATMAAGVIAARSTDWEQGGIFRTGRALQWLMDALGADQRRRAGLCGPHRPGEVQHLEDCVWRGRWNWFLPLAEIPAQYFGPMHRHYLDWLKVQHVDTWRLMDTHVDVSVPVLNWTGWYDRLIRTVDHFTHIREVSRYPAAREGQRLIMGPWSHGHFGGATVGECDFGPAAAVDYGQMLLRWFDHHLRGADNGVMDGEPIDLFVMGRNQWRGEPDWPLQRAVETVFHFRSDGRLSRDEPGDEEPDTYDCDPRDPYPTLYGQRTQDEPHDYRVLDHRTDVRHYQTDPLPEPMELTGEPRLLLWAASSALDTDWIVRLLDVHPDGFAQGLCYGVVRARYRHGFDRPERLTPGEPTAYEIQLNPIGIELGVGHRLRVDLTSADFPNFDRNHNTGGDDYFEATLKTARQTIFHDRHRASRLLAPVVRE